MTEATERRERPIIFSGEMVRAILDGRKTMTRRVVKCAATTTDIRWAMDVETTPKGSYTGWIIECDAPLLLPLKCPYGKPGDLFWVRETWGSKEADHPLCPDGRKPQQGDSIVYRANPADDYQWGSGRASQGSFVWRPSIHMPRWASRITLEVTDVSVERVQKITEAGAIAEGICMESDYASLCINQETAGYSNELPKGSAVLAVFKNLWDTLNAKRGYSWDSNSWVWVVEFKRRDTK